MVEVVEVVEVEDEGRYCPTRNAPHHVTERVHRARLLLPIHVTAHAPPPRPAPPGPARPRPRMIIGT